MNIPDNIGELKELCGPNLAEVANKYLARGWVLVHVWNMYASTIDEQPAMILGWPSRETVPLHPK
tara:strand:+ start:1071 stop:1265 length:195 start_codon:yes stop_codon:yes gene_type:complete